MAAISWWLENSGTWSTAIDWMSSTGGSAVPGIADDMAVNDHRTGTVTVSGIAVATYAVTPDAAGTPLARAYSPAVRTAPDAVTGTPGPGRDGLDAGTAYALPYRAGILGAARDGIPVMDEAGIDGSIALSAGRIEAASRRRS